jgi:hypothetical protein
VKKTAYLLFLTSFALLGQKTIYQSEKFEELSKTHNTLAILPFLATLRLAHTENLSQTQLSDLQEKEGYAVQDALETYFLKRKKKKGFTVAFQNTKNTNALLAKNNINITNIDVFTTHELCNILGVDGVISGNITLNKLLSKGVTDDDFGLISLFTGKTDYGRIAVKISDGKTGKLLWKYEKTIDRKSGKNTRAIIEAMMRQSSRKFPYDKEKNK